MHTPTTCDSNQRLLPHAVLWILLLLPMSVADAITIRGTVVDDLNVPVSGAIVYAGHPRKPVRVVNNRVQLGERYPRAISDGRGQFSLEISDGAQHVLFARDLEDRSGFASASGEGDVTVRIQSSALLEPQLPGDGGLQPGELLQLRAKTPAGLSYLFSASARVKSPYLFSEVLPGEYLLETTHEVPQLGCCFKRVTTRQVSAEVIPGRKTQVQLGGHDLPYLRGTITDADGAGLHGVWVRLTPETSTSKPVFLTPSQNVHTPRVWSAVTAQDGSYRVDDLMPGVYTLRAFRRLALNSGSHTLEQTEDVLIPKDAVLSRTPYTRDLSIDLGQFAPLRTGDTAPEIDAETLDGASFQLRDLRDRIVVIHFFAGWCSPCVATIEEYNELAASFAESPVTVLGVSLDETEEEARAFAVAKGLNHPVIFQGSWSQNSIRKAYRVNGIPFTVVIGADGKVLRQNLHGDRLKDDVARAVRALADIGK